jgi:hypothetical protein
MPEWLIGIICLASGVTAVATGLLLTTHRVRRIRRSHARRAQLFAAKADGWDVWFAQGFADMMVGTHLVVAGATLLAWILLGAWLTGLGLRVALMA